MHWGRMPRGLDVAAQGSNGGQDLGCTEHGGCIGRWGFTNKSIEIDNGWRMN